MSRTYHHLSAEERALIMIERQNGSSLRSIARRLGRSPATVSRELRRVGTAAYDATQAAQGYRARRQRSRRPRLLTAGTELYQDVRDRLVTYRYGRGSILITTNKSVREWTELLAGDEALAAAILDRLLHKAHVLNIKGRSYRLRDLEATLGATTN